MLKDNSQRIGAALQYDRAWSKNLHNFGHNGFVADDMNNLEQRGRNKKQTKRRLVILCGTSGGESV
jgi:hypothetical protein